MKLVKAGVCAESRFVYILFQYKITVFFSTSLRFHKKHIHIHSVSLHRHDAQSHKTHLYLLCCVTQSALPAAVLAVMEKAQRGGADGERARREPGQQTQPALLTAAILVRIGLVLLVVLGGFCFRGKIFSSERNVAAHWVWAKRSNLFLLFLLTADTKTAPSRR